MVRIRDIIPNHLLQPDGLQPPLNLSLGSEKEKTMKRLIVCSLIIVGVFFVLTTPVSAYTERESIMNGTHTLSWAYFTGDNSRWYISPTSGSGTVYSQYFGQFFEN